VAPQTHITLADLQTHITLAELLIHITHVDMLAHTTLVELEETVLELVGPVIHTIILTQDI